MNYCVIAALHLKTLHRVLLTLITENRHISFFFFYVYMFADIPLVGLKRHFVQKM